MDISVIVPIYNVEKYIEQCLISIFNQTKTENVEFILVNDCTLDKSMHVAHKIIAKYPHLQVEIVNKKQNGGLAAARQSGVDIARGNYIMHIDSDDWCDSTMLEDLFCIAKKNDADIVACDYYINSNSTDIYNSLPISDNALQCVNLILGNAAFGSLCNKLIKNDLYKKNKIRVITPNLNMNEDFIISSKLFCCAQSVSYLPKAFYHYRQNANSITRKISTNTYRNIIDALAEVEAYFCELSLIDKFKTGLMYRKLYAKSWLLYNSRNADQIEFSKIFPEATSYVWSHPSLRLDHKVALFFASHKCLAVTNIIYSLTLFFKRLLK